MATYLLTGGATGIGAAIKHKLSEAGHRVVTVDIRDGDYLADLSDPSERARVIAAIDQDLDHIDGIITSAGVASHFPDKPKIIAINYFGTVDLVEGLLHKLPRDSRVIAISSNSAPQCGVPALVDAMLAGDADAALVLAEEASGHDCYSGSKQAVARWMRLRAPDYARRGIAINAIAPGYIETPMTEAVAKSEQYGEAIKQFVNSIPIGRAGTTDDIAHLVEFLLSPEAGFIAGSLIFADGGHDAMFRADRSV